MCVFYGASLRAAGRRIEVQGGDSTNPASAAADGACGLLVRYPRPRALLRRAHSTGGWLGGWVSGRLGGWVSG